MPEYTPDISGGRPRTYRFRILRYDHSRPVHPHFDTYEIDLTPRTSVLEALLRLQDEQDGSLAFRFSCRGAICGSCAAIINGQPDLACRVQVAELGGEEIVLEPLAKLRVLKDLVVEMEPFWAAYRRVEPWLVGPRPGDGEHRMSADQVRKVEAFANCVLCASCVSACPVEHRDPSFMGPAAMAALYRHVADSRDHRPAGFLNQFDDADGLWGCDTVFRCCEVCPKQVRPTDAITALRRKLVVQAMRGWLTPVKKLVGAGRGNEG